MHRRDALKGLGAAAAAGLMGFSGRGTQAETRTYSQQTTGMPPVKITNVKAIPTCPHGIELVVVKVETDEPGLYGVGCATFRQRAHAVVTAVDKYLNDFCKGKEVDNIEDIWQTAYVSSYWRNGPVLNNALSGLDQALWDIKGKRAGMPLYQLLGGKCRFAVDTYTHASGATIEEVAEQVQRYMEQGFRHIRIQLGGYGSGHLSGQADFKQRGFGMPEDNYMDPYPYLTNTPKMFGHVRKVCGEEIELLHDIHERVDPNDAINLIKALEQYRPFFIEDPFSPEDIGYFPHLKQQTSIPIAMGELYNNPHEWVGLLTDRL
ncbi:MAG TPA: enolase C-terminal domain-like protein, partial [bacterium]|nr:enolase C-terminal domain-like protein [bacterium]